ncbi:hypothetical protein AB0K21_36290 [Streptosporangium sp. NPDC049248]|uniref:hypothetical protein n=1 Tax=Streptosporangium sp. NPDC049248 TaxID=3155651 RepID=UPI003447B5EE
MTTPPPSVDDAEWLEPEHLYHQVGSACEIDRPVFQGDVYHGVPLPVMPSTPPEPGKVLVDFVESMVMLVPHPCQCYHGDKLRPRLTVAPVTEVPHYDNFGPERAGAMDKFALPDLPVLLGGKETVASHVADFGRLVSIPNRYLHTSRRMACLSHLGLGLLAKRLLRFQIRMPSTLANTTAYTFRQWNESFVMQAWIRSNGGSLKGFSDWLRTPQVIPALDPVHPVVPGDYLDGALDVLIEEISGKRPE